MRYVTIALALMLATPAMAQQAPCGQRDSMVRRLDAQHGERVAVRMTTDSGRALLEIYVNPETGGWTVLKSPVSRPEIVCFIGAGENFHFAGGAKPGESS